MVRWSVADIWDDTVRFVKQEHALLLPIGFATFGLGILTLSLTAPARTAETAMTAGPWMLWMIPVALLMILGNLAISLMVLRRGSSVGEALQTAGRLFPSAITIVLLLLAAVMVLATAISIFLMVLAKTANLDARAVNLLVLVTLFPPLLWMTVKLALLWPSLAALQGGARNVLTHAISLTRGNMLRLAGIMFLNFIVYGVLTAVMEITGGSVILLLTKLAGVDALGTTLVAILMAAFSGAYVTVWTVFLANLYLAITGSSKGM